MQRRLAHVGVALVLLGAVALAAPTFGFSTIAADRGTGVQTAEDPNALLGFEPTTEAVTGRQDTATAFYLRNNADQTLTLSTTNTLSTADVRIAADGSGTIAPGEATQVVVECAGGGGSGTATLTTEVTEASGATVSILGASSSTTFDYQCTGNGGGGTGPASFVAGDVQVDGSQRWQVFEFNADALGSNGQATIDLSDAHANSGVDYSGAQATLLSGQRVRNVAYDHATRQLTFEAQGSVSGTVRIELSGLQVPGDQDGTAYYSDTAGRSDQDGFAVPYVVSGSENGEITTDGDVVLQDGATVNDDIDAGGDVIAGDGVTTHGAVEADGAVTYGTDATLNDDVTAGGSFAVGADSTVNHQVDAGGTVDVGARTVVYDDLLAGDDTTLGDDVTVYGDVTVDGTLYEGCNVRITGQVTADARVDDC